jgi:hypothetical protein
MVLFEIRFQGMDVQGIGMYMSVHGINVHGMDAGHGYA